MNQPVYLYIKNFGISLKIDIFDFNRFSDLKITQACNNGSVKAGDT
jgi:hypothetical protein